MKKIKLFLCLIIITSFNIKGQDKEVQLIISSNIDQTSKLIQIDVTLINNTKSEIAICPLHDDCEDNSNIFWTIDISNEKARFKPFSKPSNISQCYPICKDLERVKGKSRISMKLCIDFSTLIRLDPTFNVDDNKRDSVEKDYDLYMNPQGFYSIKLIYHFDKETKGVVDYLESNEIKIDYKK
jgi:hypothetical protein